MNLSRPTNPAQTTRDRCKKCCSFCDNLREFATVCTKGIRQLSAAVLWGDAFYLLLAHTRRTTSQQFEHCVRDSQLGKSRHSTQCRVFATSRGHRTTIALAIAALARALLNPAAAIVACDRELFEASETGDSAMNNSKQNRKQCTTGPSMLRKTGTLWLAMLGLLAVVLPFGSGCDETQLRQLVADSRDAAEDLDPWTKFCLINASAEDFAACEAGHVE